MITVAGSWYSLKQSSEDYNRIDKLSARTKEAEQQKSGTSEEAEDTGVSLTLSKIQQYLSRSRQLQSESKEDDVTASGRQQIRSEINKINVVVSNLTVGNDSDQVENMVNSIDMTGDLVSHYAGNILTNASESLYAQSGIDNMEAYALLV